MPKHTVQQSAQPRGFTIVELLIVVVVIAILAAITIVAYNGIQRRASESAATSAASQAKKKISVWQVENANQSPDQTTFSSLIGNTAGLEYTPGSNGAYCITSTSGTVSYAITESTNPTAGGCQGHAQGGVAAITNFHINPGAITTNGYGQWPGDAGSTTTTGVVAAPWAQSGSAYRVTWTAIVGTNGDIQVALNNGSTLTAGTTYTVRYSLASGQNSSVSAPATYASAGTHTTIARSTTADTALTAGVPVTFWVTFQADSTALTSGMRILHQPRAKAVGHSYLFSDTVTYLGAYNSNIGFYWGNSPNWTWNGTVNNSTSKGPPL